MKKISVDCIKSEIAHAVGTSVQLVANLQYIKSDKETGIKWGTRFVQICNVDEAVCKNILALLDNLKSFYKELSYHCEK